MVHLVKENSYVLVSLDGGRILELVLDGWMVLWNGVRPDGKWAATHVCVPNFRKVRSGDLIALPQHGPSRSEKWELVSNNPLKIRWQMKEKVGNYPAGLIAEQEFRLDKTSLDYVLRLKNQSTKTILINPGVHFYFVVGDKDKVKINDQKVDPKLWLGDGSVFGIKDKNVINLGWGKIELEQAGFKQFMLWSPEGAEFVCIEPINGVDDDIYRKENELEVGKERVWRVKLGIK